MSRFRAAALLLALSIGSACGDGTSPNPIAAVAGTYHATRIVFTETGNPQVDAIALGTTLEIVLTPEGNTTGTLLIPAVLTEDGLSDVEIDLSGTFSVQGSTLRFQGQEDSFVPEVVWNIGPGTLTTTHVEPDVTIEATLTRS